MTKRMLGGAVIVVIGAGVAVSAAEVVSPGSGVPTSLLVFGIGFVLNAVFSGWVDGEIGRQK